MRIVGLRRPYGAVRFPPGQKLALQILVGGFQSPHFVRPAVPSPAGPELSGSCARRGLSPGANAREYRLCRVRPEPGRSASVPSASDRRHRRASAHCETCCPCWCRRPAAGRAVRARSTTTSCSPRWNRSARNAQSPGWWRRRSCGSGERSRHAPRASRDRRCPTGPVRRNGSCVPATGELRPSSGAADARVRLRHPQP